VTGRDYTYDSADRITTSGTVYDALGRALTTPAADTMVAAGGNVTTTYYTNDMARTISQGARTATYTLDVLPNRYRTLVDNGSGSALTKTHHYSDDADTPVWTSEGDGTWTRPLRSLVGVAGIQVGPVSGNIGWVITSLHGDLVAGLVGGSPGLAYTSEQTEYGQPRNPADIGTRRYGYLGASARSADTPSGDILMGARIYNPALGSFRQVDPVYGGSCTGYDYVCADPVNSTDLDGTVGCVRSATQRWKGGFPARRHVAWNIHCWATDRDVRTGLFLMGLMGAVLGVAGNLISFLADFPSVVLTVLGKLVASGLKFIGSSIAAAALLATASYFFFCRRQNGVFIDFYLEISYTPIILIPKVYWKVARKGCS
jgi:RHS repeat-associated protein